MQPFAFSQHSDVPRYVMYALWFTEPVQHVPSRYLVAPKRAYARFRTGPGKGLFLPIAAPCLTSKAPRNCACVFVGICTVLGEQTTYACRVLYFAWPFVSQIYPHLQIPNPFASKSSSYNSLHEIEVPNIDGVTKPLGSYAKGKVYHGQSVEQE